MKIINDVIKEEEKKLNQRVGRRMFVYINYPFPSGIDEATSHLKGFAVPETRLSIKRKEKETVLSIKPKKGARKRKPLLIRLWV